MKALFALVVLVSTSAFAANAPSTNATPELAAQFPAAIKCTSGATSSYVKSFTIEKLNTVKPEASIFDQGLMDPMTVIEDKFTKAQRIDLGFSNECDNEYGVQFFVNDLIALQSGSLSQVYGYLQYADTQVEDATGGLTQEERLVITCTR